MNSYSIIIFISERVVNPDLQKQAYLQLYLAVLAKCCAKPGKNAGACLAPAFFQIIFYHIWSGILFLPFLFILKRFGSHICYR